MRGSKSVWYHKLGANTGGGALGYDCIQASLNGCFPS